MGWGSSMQRVCSWTGLVTPASFILLSPSYGMHLPSCCSRDLEHISAVPQLQTAAPETSSAAWRNPHGLCKIKAVLGVSWGRAREKGLDFCNFIHLSFGKYFLPQRLALMLLMVPWTHYIESIKIHISDFLPLKNEDLLYTTIKPCPQR